MRYWSCPLNPNRDRIIPLRPHTPKWAQIGEKLLLKVRLEVDIEIPAYHYSILLNYLMLFAVQNIRGSFVALTVKARELVCR